MKIQIPPGVMPSDYRRLDPNLPLGGWDDVLAIAMRWTWRNSPYSAMAALAESDEPVEMDELAVDMETILKLASPTLVNDQELVRRLREWLW